MTTQTSARTVIGPLTTTFTPPLSCSVGIVNNGYPLAWQAQQCVDNGVADATDCWPPAALGAPTPSPPFNGWGFYSPGLVCPFGYTEACSATAGGKSGWPVEYFMLPGETAIGCCSEGYSCSNGDGRQTCVRSVATGTPFQVATCSDRSTEGFTAYTLPFTSTYASSTQTYSTYVMMAPMIEIRWQSSDVPATASRSSLTTAPNTSSPTSTPAQSQHSTSSSSSLSTGAAIAIGVSVPLTVLALLAGAFILWRRRRKSRRPTYQDDATHPDLSTDLLGPSEQYVDGQDAVEMYPQKSELQGRQVYEVEIRQPELESRALHEME